MKGFQRFLALALCAGLLLSAGACSQVEKESSSQDSTPSVSVVESEPTPTPTPTPTPAPSAEATPTPQVTVAPSGDFEEEFEANPIDAKLEDDLVYATSNGLIQKAYNKALSRWQTVIQTAYSDGESALAGETLIAFQEEQKTWEKNLDGEIQKIQDENSEDPLNAAKLTVDYYRDRAKTLCQTVYEATGKMPQFPSTDEEAVG